MRLAWVRHANDDSLLNKPHLALVLELRFPAFVSLLPVHAFEATAAIP